MDLTFFISVAGSYCTTALDFNGAEIIYNLTGDKLKILAGRTSTLYTNNLCSDCTDTLSNCDRFCIISDLRTI